MINPLDQLVEKLGGYDKLDSAEREVYREHLKIIEGKAITIDDSKSFVRNMISAIERALVDTKEKSPESINLKARLKNFLMLEQFLFTPERAKKALETYYKERL